MPNQHTIVAKERQALILGHIDAIRSFKTNAEAMAYFDRLPQEDKAGIKRLAHAAAAMRSDAQ